MKGMTDLSEEELQKKVEAHTDKVIKVFITDFNDLDLYLIKCHIFLEHELNTYIEGRTKKRVPMEKANFTFAEKVKIAKMLGCFEQPESMRDLEKFLTLLNDIRNKIGHTFEYDKNKLQQLIDIANIYNGQHDEPPIIKPKKLMFNTVLGSFCGYLHNKPPLDELVVVKEYLEREKLKVVQVKKKN